MFVLDDLLTIARKHLGVFGPFSVRLLLGLALGLASLFLFAAVAEDLLTHQLIAFDNSVTSAVRYYSSDRITYVMKIISLMGSPLTLTVVGAIAMLYTGLVRKHFWDMLLVPISLIGGIILNSALKLLFHRQRPELPHLVRVSGLSFPSGHAMMSFIFYGLLIFLMWANFRGRFFKGFLTAIFTILIVAIGISRIYLGVHFPSDVVAGFAAGSFWLVACILGLRGIRYYKADG